MKKLFTIMIIGILLLSGIGAFAYQEKTEYSSAFEIIQISKPLVVENDNGYSVLKIAEANSHLTNTGEPILPRITRKYVYPLGTKIRDVQVIFSDVKAQSLSKKIALAPAPSTMINGKEIKASVNPFNQENIDYYPEKKYSYTIHVGLQDNEHVVILNVQCYPVQYHFEKNCVYYSDEASIDIQYELPEQPIEFQDVYDMVIIAPEKFSADLEPLITHKNNYGVKTTLKTTESIYQEYDGRDQPEQIKYFIKDAIETWNISYVLLCGGKKSFLFGNWGMESSQNPNDELWHVPVRYANVDDLAYPPDDDPYPVGYLSDLYFADVYKYKGGELVFDNWDKNKNNIFAEWNLDVKESPDYYPDVYVGRLACRNNKEVQIMVDKIITYETGCDPSWFNKIVGVGGDSFNDLAGGYDYLEGEERNQLAFDYLSGFIPVTVWASNRDTGGLTLTKVDILTAINDGCGFIYFAGHASATYYRTYWYHDWNRSNATEEFSIYTMMLRLRNDEKLPICVIGACEPSRFNVSFFNFLKAKTELYPTPECWSWTFTSKSDGGAIATIGYTQLEWVATWGWDDVDDGIPDCTQYVSGYLDSRFFHAYGVEGIDILGEAWGKAISDYRDRFLDSNNKWDGKTPQQWLLLGDPSLKIGGY
jgi:hypothetical protein